MFKSEWLKRRDILRSFVANSFAAKVLVIVNKFILFWFLFIKSGRYKNKKTRDYQEQRRMGLRMFGSKLFFMPHICWIFFLSACYVFSFLFLFPGILGNDSLWFPFPNFGNRFFHSLPIPKFWECFFFIPFPFPNWGNGFFQFPSRSRNSGMELSIPVPVPELRNFNPDHPWLICWLHVYLMCKVVQDSARWCKTVQDTAR